ncbi:MAG TPA: HEPN domain-containing protein [Candidatus Bathyarchaeia archaeon]|nr:HEPN domain-containing protein [Candidatus Bathyarchaeia archaeon]
MNPETVAYVRYRTALAQENLDVAKLALTASHLRSAVNRLYYACFYMVSALLFAEGRTSSKHSGIRSLFNRHWIKTGRLPVEMSAFYRDLFNHRQQGDYDDFVEFACEDVQTWYEQANAFVTRISQEIEKLLSATPKEDG